MSNELALKCWSCKEEFTLKERADCDGCCWRCGVEIDLEDYAEKFAGEVERLRAEVDKLQLKVGQSFWDKQDRDDTIDDLRVKLASLEALLEKVYVDSGFRNLADDLQADIESSLERKPS